MFCGVSLLLLLSLLVSTTSIASSSRGTTFEIHAGSGVEVSDAEELSPPTIDIAPLLSPDKYSTTEVQNAKNLIKVAAEKWGFYNIINHNISLPTLQRVQDQMRRFFALPTPMKKSVRRTAQNSRGFADDEYTKQKIDLKEVFDFGQLQPYSAIDGLSPEAERNQRLDGENQWLEEDTLPEFRTVMEEFYRRCYELSNTLMNAIIDSLIDDCQNNGTTSATSFSSSQDFFDKNFNLHTSMFRLNYYPIHQSNEPSESAQLGISRHTDAGALTILLQDLNVSSLEVYSGSKQDRSDGHWVPVTPVPNALTINSGDMLQVWSNNRLKAPEHRVRATNSRSPHPRYSIAFFLNPNYDSLVSPFPCNGESPVYHPIRWGDFRSQRYQGDYADIGEEIQIERYLVEK